MNILETDAYSWHKISIGGDSLTYQELLENNYQVAITTYIYSNEEIGAYEYGIRVDERCTYEVITDPKIAAEYGVELCSYANASFVTSGSITWFSWTSSKTVTEIRGYIALILVTLPEDTLIADTFTIEYLESYGNLEHAWLGTAENGYETLQNGEYYDGQIKIAYEYFKSGDWSYRLIEDGTIAELTRYGGTDSTVKVPTEIDGYPVTSLSFAFSGTLVTSVYIPNSITHLDGASFDGVYITKVLVSENNPYYQDIDGIVYDKEGTTLVYLPPTESGTYIVADFVEHIGDYAFYGSENITEIIIPESVQSIGYGAFCACVWLSTVAIYNPNCEIADFICEREYNSPLAGLVFGYAGSTTETHVAEFEDECTFVAFENMSDGDVNFDGEINASDASKLLVYAAEVGANEDSTDFGYMCQSIADYNHDGKIDASDSSAILMYAANLGVD